MREDYATLSEKLRLSDEEIKDLGLWESASGPAERLTEVYIRRSKKREDVATLRGHIRDIVRRCTDLKLSIRHVWFEQLSASKRSVERREYAAALKAVLDGKSRAFTVWKLDRFDRLGAGSVISAVDRLETRRGRLISYTENLDSSQPGARAFIAWFAENARDEANNIGKRVKIGLDEHKASGRHGPGAACYGTEVDSETGQVSARADHFPTTRRLCDLLMDGNSYNKTAYMLNAEGLFQDGKPWTGAGVRRLSQNPVFAGMVPYRERQTDEYGNLLEVWARNSTPLLNADSEPIMCGKGPMTPAEYFHLKAAARTRVNKTGRGVRDSNAMVSQTLKCPFCYDRMLADGAFYRCANRRDRGPSICKGTLTGVARVDAAVSTAWVNHVSALEPDSVELYEIGRRWLRFTSPETEAMELQTADALASAQSRLTELEDRYWNPPATGHRIPAEMYERQARSIAESIGKLQSKLKEHRAKADVSVLLDADLLREAWLTADIELKKILVKAVWPSGILLLAPKFNGDRTPIAERLDFSGVPDSKIRP